MTARKSERLMNLLITLLVSRGFVTKQKLREVIPDYRGAATDEAFEKMFERDKDDLRALGIPIEIGGYDPLFDDASGYRINRDAFELPDITLAPDEAAVLGLAARVWQQAGLAAATSDALLKLRAAGVELDREMLDVAQPLVGADEPQFETFWEAVSSRRTVRFGYRTATSAQVQERTLQPWGIVSYRSRWYVVGHDVGRDAPRLFRMSRVVGDVVLVDEPGSFEVPEGTDIRALTGMLAPPASSGERTATVRVRPGRAVALRHRHDAAAADPTAGTVDGWETLTVRFGRLDTLAEEITAYGPDVVVDEPAELRDAVRARLSAVVRSA